MSTSGTGGARNLREHPQTTLGGAYTVRRELGGGGMSRVFVAEETTLGRRVVVKVLPPEASGVASADRFRREVHLAAQLQHPHIVPLLAAGETGTREAGDSLLYYTMPFVEGETLRARLARDGALPVPVAIRVLRDVTKALAYAHRHAVVHRDIKPENILLGEDGDALVADFGVAKALAAATADTSDVAGAAGVRTSRGIAVGTPAYMAPEQAVADPQADHRADLYSLGVVAYEVLAGSHPFPGRTPHALVAAHATEAPESLARRRPSVPPPLAALVMRLLEKHPSDRPQSADVVLQGLDSISTPSGISTEATLAPTGAARLVGSRRALGVIAALVVAVAAGAAWYFRAVPSDPTDRRVLVVPLENQTGDSALGPLGRMASEWIAQGLATIGSLDVTSGLAKPPPGGEVGLRAAAAESQAGTVVSGAYYIEGDSIRFQTSVIDVAGWKLLPGVRAVRSPKSNATATLDTVAQRVMAVIARARDPRVAGWELRSNSPCPRAFRTLPHRRTSSKWT